MIMVVACMFASLGFLIGAFMRYMPFSQVVTVKQKKLIYSLYVLLFLVNFGVMCILSDSFSIAYVKYNLIVWGVLTTLVNVVVIRGKVREHLFTYGLVSTLNFMISSLGMFIAYKTVGLDTVQGILWNCVLYFLILVVCFPLLRKLINDTIQPFLTMDCEDYWRTIWFVPVAFFFAMFFVFPMNAHMTEWNQVVSRVLLNLATVVLCWNMARDHVQMRTKQLLMEQLNMQKEYYEELHKRVLDARKQKHDFKHHISVIRRFLELDDKDGLLLYLNELSSDIVNYVQIPYTGNAAMDGILYFYMSQAEENQIDFSYSGVVEKMKIMDTDFCVLMGNALDNALNGCLMVDANRFIRVEITSRGLLQSIVITNSYDGVVLKNEDKWFSRKRIGKEGIGISSMLSICEKYQAYMDIRYDDHNFAVMFLIPLEEENV